MASTEFREIRTRLLLTQSYNRMLEQIVDRLVTKFVPAKLQHDMAALDAALFNDQEGE